MRSIDFSQKPYIEIFDGEVRVKMPPLFGPHGLAATRIGIILSRLAGERGFVSTEPHMRLGAIDGTDTVFVPDVAYVEKERFYGFADVNGMPDFGPDIAVEVRSPYVTPAQLGRKIAKYLACGSTLVLDVDPNARTIVAHCADGNVRRFERDEIFESGAFSWLRFDVAEAFSEVERYERIRRERRNP